MIVGGGIAALWTLSRLKQAGFSAVLVESEALGAGQTRYAQGIIHGGTKYALTGKLTASSEAVSDMPATWRECHQGQGDVDLSRAELNSDSHYLWSTASLASKITGFFASKVMSSRTRALDRDERPAFFQNEAFNGKIYRLDEPVFHTLSVVRALAEPVRDSVLMTEDSGIELTQGEALVRARDQNEYLVCYKRLILMAGKGNAHLLSSLGLASPSMQLRPLKMVMVRGCLTESIYAHCMGGGVNPRVTVTSHRDGSDRVVWYVGGQLAEDGVNRSNEDQLRIAREELEALMPWQSFEQCEWAVLDIDRAEVKHPDGHRPDTFYSDKQGDVIIAWPTKMALAPLLARDIENRMSEIEKTQSELPSWPAPVYADYPWCEEHRWSQS